MNLNLRSTFQLGHFLDLAMWVNGHLWFNLYFVEIIGGWGWIRVVLMNCIFAQYLEGGRFCVLYFCKGDNHKSCPCILYFVFLQQDLVGVGGVVGDHWVRAIIISHALLRRSHSQMTASCSLSPQCASSSLSSSSVYCSIDAKRLMLDSGCYFSRP